MNGICMLSIIDLKKQFIKSYEIISSYAPVAIYNPLKYQISISPAFLDEGIFKFYNSTNELQTYAGIGFILCHEMSHSIINHYLMNENQKFEYSITCLKDWNHSLFEVMNSSQLSETMADLHGMRM